MGCCNRNIDQEVPDDIEPCCGKMKGKRCFCLPYDDAFFVTAQILAIVAMFISWVFWGAFVVSAIGLTMIQIPWCCRQNAAVLYGSVAVAWVSCLASIGVGIYALVVLHDKRYCYAWDMYHGGDIYEDHWGDINEDQWQPIYDDQWEPVHQECQYKVWAAIAYVCAFLWWLVALFLTYFLTSGRHAMWEQKHSSMTDDDDNNNDTAAVAVELGSVPTPVIDTALVVSPPEEPVKVDVAA